MINPQYKNMNEVFNNWYNESIISDKKFSENLWIEVGESKKFCILYHPYYEHVYNGTLSSDKFKIYLQNNLKFLEKYCAVSNIVFTALRKNIELICKSEKDDILKKIYQVEELQKHWISKRKKLLSNIDNISSPTQNDWVVINDADIQYYNFILSSIPMKEDQGQNILEGLAKSILKLIPHLKIGIFIRDHTITCTRKTENNHALSDCLSDLETAAQLLAEIFDCIVIKLTSLKECHEEREVFVALYKEALEYDKRLLDMVMFDEEKHLKFDEREKINYSNISIEEAVNLFVADFDETCTASDTTHLIVHTAIKYSPEPEQLEEKWNVIKKWYYDESKKIFENEIEKAIERKKDINYDKNGIYGSVKILIQNISNFEKEAIAKVADSKILSGIPKGDLQILMDTEEYRNKWKFRDDCIATLKYEFYHRDSIVKILSINWSQEVIEGAFQSDGFLVDEKVQEKVEITCNNLIYKMGKDFLDKSTGAFQENVSAGIGKQEQFVRMLSNVKDIQQDNVRSIYIGDSITDILVLLEVDIGIVIGNSSTLVNLLDCFDIELKPIFNAIAENTIHEERKDGKEKKILFKARNWHEIGQLLHGVEYYNFVSNNL